MLDEWKRTRGDAATLEALQEALKMAEMDDLLDVVAGTHSYDHKKQASGQAWDYAHHTTKVSSIPYL